MQLLYRNLIIFTCLLSVTQRGDSAERLALWALQVADELARETTFLRADSEIMSARNAGLHQQNNNLHEDLQKLQEQLNESHRAYDQLLVAYKQICPATQDTPTVEKTVPEHKQLLEETRNSTLTLPTKSIDKRPPQKRLSQRQRIPSVAFGNYQPHSLIYCSLSPKHRQMLRRDDRDGC